MSQTAAMSATPRHKLLVRTLVAASIGNGGTAPLVVQSLQQAGLATLFFVYVAVGAAIAFGAILTLPETRGSVLR